MLDANISVNRPLFLGIAFDKVGHFGLFCGFSFLILWGLKKILNPYFNIKIIFFVFFIGLIYGVIIEILQHFLTTTRHADMYDVLADGIGVLAGIILFLLLFKQKKLAKKL